MTRIPEDDRAIFEKAVFLPMVLTILNRDLTAIETAGFKLKKPYLHLLEHTMKKVQKDLYTIKLQMKKKNMKVWEKQRDEAFTLFSFMYRGYEEEHNYFNPRIRNEVQQLLESYFIEKNDND
ncbi:MULTISPECIES: hypothetical protein [Fredinandcohnia]|jgi:hypothetical protein|uniref:Uncharacterized protein n=1 Tax=Fredinandcohnia salidurans TaxID=2595041 RepID=A0ABW4MPL9_9BACI|nr:hypothetical protein [Fredinandcohnia onubensis]